MILFLNWQKHRSLHIKLQLDYSCLCSSSCSVNVDGFTSPSPNSSNVIHQTPKLEWRGSEVVYLKGSLLFRYLKPPKGQPVEREKLSLGASRARAVCTQLVSVTASIMGTSQSTSGLYTIGVSHCEHHGYQPKHERSGHNWCQSLRASWVPAKARAVWTHISEHRMTHACHFMYLNACVHLSCLPS
jgi:hypothetical protein